MAADLRAWAVTGRRVRPMVNPMAGSSRLMLIPSATSASPWLLVRRLALSSSSLSSASSIQAPMPIAPAAELVGARL
jgi:hypothetical protein